MTILNHRVAAYIERVAGQFLKDTCTIERQQDTVDAAGNSKNVWLLLAEDVPCRVIQVGNSQTSASALVGQAETLTESYQVVLPVGQAVSVDYRITTGGITYSVVRLETALTDHVFQVVTVTRHR